MFVSLSAFRAAAAHRAAVAKDELSTFQTEDLESTFSWSYESGIVPDERYVRQHRDPATMPRWEDQLFWLEPVSDEEIRAMVQRKRERYEQEAQAVANFESFFVDGEYEY